MEVGRENIMNRKFLYMVIDKLGKKTRFYSYDRAMDFYNSSGVRFYYWWIDRLDYDKCPRILVYWKDEQSVNHSTNIALQG